MPIYEYACHSCTHRFETIQKAAENPLRDCPECGEPKLKKLLSAPVFRLKGSGWYETDFKTGDKRNVVESGDAKGGEGKGDDSAASNGGGEDGKNGKKTADASAKGEAKAKPGGESASPTKEQSASNAKTSGGAGGQANAAAGKPKQQPKPSG